MEAEEAHAADRPVYSLVPFAAPIVLNSYYSRFRDYYPEAELQTKRWLVTNVSRDWVFLDVGANVGVYSILFSRLAPEGHVYAFEPTQTVELLKANLAAEGSTNVSVHGCALGAVDGDREDSICRIWGESPETNTYRFTTLDSFVRRTGLTRLECVKIGVDGFDLEVLKGAVDTLQRFNPWIIVEINHALATRGQSIGEALLWLVGQGYTDAIVMDNDNLVLKRSHNGNRSGVLQLRFDREPVFLPPVFVPGPTPAGLFAPRPVLHNAAREEDDGSLVVPGPIWSYAATWPTIDALASGSVVVEVELEVLAGKVGVGCLTADMTAYEGKEIAVSAAPGKQTVLLSVPEGANVAHLIVRSNEPAGRESRLRMHGLKASRSVPAKVSCPPILCPKTRCFQLDHVADPAAPMIAHRKIAVVPVSELGDELEFSMPYVPEKMIYRHGLRDFNTQVDEPQIYRYLYDQFRPQRHLEFGTWEGFGTALCAESCDAQIWTINLPEGEHDASGVARYSAPSGQVSDAGDQIGWRYRAAGFESRIHQLLMDSRELSVADFGPGFFDSVLIDGGHAPDVVASDTEKALQLVRSGGLVLWHDFCPEPETFAACESAHGVVTAWIVNHDRWRPSLAKLFWVRPSWLLVGIRQ